MIEQAKIDIRFKGIGRLLWLTAMSIFLCYSLFMSIFAPLPLIMAFLAYGRSKAVLASIFGLSVILVIIYFYPHLLFFSLLYLFGILVAVMASETILRDLHPVKGLFLGGSGIVLILAIGAAALYLSVEGDFRQGLINYYSAEVLPMFKEQAPKLISSGGELEQERMALFLDPAKVINTMLMKLPFFMVMIVFFSLWAQLILVIRGQKVLIHQGHYSFHEGHLLNFKVPEWVIWPFILILGATLYFHSAGKMDYAEIGLNMIFFVFGLVYFFQGFGVFVALLDRFAIGGFFRSALVVLMVITARELIALVGLFDSWVDFRKMIFKKEN